MGKFMTISKQTKLSQRLKTIYQFSIPNVPLWDIACDHGQLGAYALTDNVVAEVHFCDQVPQIIDKIKKKYGEDLENVYFHAVPGENLSLDKNSQASIIIAGVGGETIIKILKSWDSFKHPGKLRYILCPHQSVFKLREELSQSNLKLYAEELILERGHYREILVLEEEGESIHPYFTQTASDQKILTAYWKRLEEQLAIKNKYEAKWSDALAESRRCLSVF